MEELKSSLKETDSPPRKYRPPCTEVDSSKLTFGAEYFAQTTGLELRVDQSGNLRTSDKSLVQAPREAVEQIVRTNDFRRAVRTPCGHLICRTEEKKDQEDVWIYLGPCGTPEELQAGEVEKLIIKSVSGRRVISRKNGRGEEYARGPDKAKIKDAGLMKTLLLEWIQEQEQKCSMTMRDLYWNGDKSYWLEVNGERIDYGEAPSALEFPD